MAVFCKIGTIFWYLGVVFQRISPSNPQGDDGGDDDGDGNIHLNPPPVLTPRDEISRSA